MRRAIFVVLGLCAPLACGDDDGQGNQTPDAHVPDAQVFVCGNGVVDANEECDDGNLINGDGCSSQCQWEGVCGNGLQEPPEECDGTDGLPTCVQLGYLDGVTTCSATCLVQADCTDEATDLVAWYKLDDTNSLVVDSTFQGHGCTPNGDLERGFPGVVDEAYLFNGTDAYADCGTPAAFGGMEGLTLEAWVKVNEYTAEGMLVSRAEDPDHLAYALGLAGGTNHLGATSYRLFFAVQGFSSFAESAESLPTGHWRHVAAVYETGALVLYLDGEETGSATQVDTGPVATLASAHTQLGHLYDGSGTSNWQTFYAGYLDDVKIWASARSPAQVCTDAGGTPGAAGACTLSAP